MKWYFFRFNNNTSRITFNKHPNWRKALIEAVGCLMECEFVSSPRKDVIEKLATGKMKQTWSKVIPSKDFPVAYTLEDWKPTKRNNKYD